MFTKRSNLLLLFCVAITAFGLSRVAIAKHIPRPAVVPSMYQNDDASSSSTIEDLIKDRIDSEWRTAGPNFMPELMRTEADYARVSATSPRDVLFESSFHLQPHYYSHAAMGPDTSFRVYSKQPIMYYIGYARTPLALPVVSNLSKNLSGDEASYTVNIGILPLPEPGSADSMRYFIILEREIESNTSDNRVPLERFHKEFAAKIGEPVFIRFADERPEKGAYIVKMENGNVLDFYDDFARFIEEHIILKSEPLKFDLGQQSLSDISERLSIPYSVAQTCHVKIELLSVVDTAHPLTIVDTTREPADYLAEADLSQFADGPYKYRLIATDDQTGKVLYTETAAFQKSAPVMVMQGSRMGTSDTLVVGGNKIDWAKLLNETSSQLATERVINQRDQATLSDYQNTNHDLELIVKSQKQSTIADVHFRAGVGFGGPSGDNFFIGIEANRPSLAFDVSFGWLYGGTNYLSYTATASFGEFFQSPASLGFQLSWIPVKFFDGILEPLVGVANYDEWSTPIIPGGVSSAALLGAQLGIASEPLGELNGLGLSLSYGSAWALGINKAATTGLSFKAYVRF